MRKVLALAALLSLIYPAMAADMAVKAKPLAVGYPTTACGLYYGINAEGGAGVVPGAPAGTTVVGGDVGALVGYACPLASLNWFAEAIIDFQNLNAGNNGFSLSGPLHLEQRVGVQTPLFAFIGSVAGTQPTTLAVPMLPPGVTINGPAQNYVYGAINEDDISASIGLASARAWLISPEIGTGALWQLVMANGTPIVADTFAGIELQSDSMCLGSLTASMCPKLGPRFKIGTSFKY